MGHGRKLLELFREEQEKNGNTGCMCPRCVSNMQSAYERFEEEGFK